METLIFLGAIAVIVPGSTFVAAEFRRIAAMKGYDEARYFWWTFLVGPVGMLMVVALPQEAKVPDAVKPDELHEILRGSTMSERYSKLFSLPENLYAEGAPVIVSAGNLLKDNQTGKVLAQLKIKNITEKDYQSSNRAPSHDGYNRQSD